MDWALNPVERMLVATTTFVPLFHQHVFAGGSIVGVRVCSWVDDHLFPPVVCRVTSSTMNASQWVKILVRHRIDFPVLNDVHGVFSNGTLPPVVENSQKPWRSL